MNCQIYKLLSISFCASFNNNELVSLSLRWTRCVETREIQPNAFENRPAKILVRFMFLSPRSIEDKGVEEGGVGVAIARVPRLKLPFSLKKTRTEFSSFSNFAEKWIPLSSISSVNKVLDKLIKLHCFCHHYTIHRMGLCLLKKVLMEGVFPSRYCVIGSVVCG